MKRLQDEIILVLIYLLGIVWMILNRLGKLDIMVCPTKWLFHIPCPGCGMTRAANLLLNGDIVGALRMNPNIVAVTILVMVALPLLISSLFTSKNYIERIDHKLNTSLFLIPFSVFEVLVWAYNILRGA